MIETKIAFANRNLIIGSIVGLLVAIGFLQSSQTSEAEVFCRDAEVVWRFSAEFFCECLSEALFMLFWRKID